MTPPSTPNALPKCRVAMTPTRWILLCCVSCIVWVPIAIALGPLGAQNQNAAGEGIYSYITAFLLLLAGGLAFGIPALIQAYRRKPQVHVCMRIVAWIILLSPVLVAGWAILSELVGDLFR